MGVRTTVLFLKFLIYDFRERGRMKGEGGGGGEKEIFVVALTYAFIG